MIESNIYLEMILHTNLDLTSGSDLAPPKTYKTKNIGGVNPPI